LDQLIFNTHDVILLTTIYQSILFGLLIFWVKRDHHQSEYFLIGFLLVQAAIPLHILINYGEAFRFIALDISPNLYRAFEIAYWLEGPLLLWYTRSLVYKNYSLTRIDFLYIVPALLYLVYISITFFALDHETKYVFLRDYDVANGDFFLQSLGFVREALRIIFSVMCLIDIRHCRQQIRDRYSNVDEIDLGWLNFLVTAFLLVRIWAVFVSLALILSVHFGFNIDYGAMGLAGNYTVFLLVSTLIFFSLRRSSIFEGVESRETIDEESNSEAKLEVDPSLVKRVTDHMETNKPYLAKILTLELLARQLDMPSRTLSTTINRQFKQNFFEFVNHYRVEEAKAQLADFNQKDKTMIDIMADCGFNSKATFNTFFKKMVGRTPSQYREAQLKKAS